VKELGFGRCSKAQHFHEDLDEESAAQWLTCVVDGSDYFAALLTKRTFGCVLWEGGE
jgi:hypothetical protein